MKKIFIKPIFFAALFFLMVGVCPAHADEQPDFYDSAAWDAAQEAVTNTSPLIINEVMPANNTQLLSHSIGEGDWVELKNNSAEELQLSAYYLTDDVSSLRKSRLKGQLAPGQMTVIFCDSDGREDGLPCTSFSLKTEETLYLTDGENIIDLLPLAHTKPDGTVGRMTGKNGYFFFSEPTPGEANIDGKRRVSRMPEAKEPDGVYENLTMPLLVQLSAEGAIYYTLDGTEPTADSMQYTAPLVVSSTCVIRAVAVEEGALASSALTLNYIINEEHDLPVACLVSDGAGRLNHLEKSGSPSLEIAGNLSYYDEKGSFSADCGISLGGSYALQLNKKSFNIHMRSGYGPKSVHYDIFGNGINKFSSLVLRSGQDSHSLIFRTEMWQDLAYEMSPELLSQSSRFCVLYLNGEYYGLMCLKEDLSDDYYASHRNVDADSVENARTGRHTESDIYDDVFVYGYRADMTDSTNYEHFKEMFNIDMFIDWVIIEGVSGNFDLLNNIRFFCSKDTGHVWEPALFDLDQAFMGDESAWQTVYGGGNYASERLAKLMRNLMKNDEFRNQFLTRYSEVYDTILSNKKILERLDHYEQHLAKEAERDWSHWGIRPGKWNEQIDTIRKMIVTKDWQNYCVDSFFRHSKLPDEIRTAYFG